MKWAAGNGRLSRPALPNRKSAFENGPAFTILELLVATSVMALMLVLLLQITSHTMQASKLSTQQMDSTQSARQILDALAGDIAHAVLTDGSTILTLDLGGAPSLAFLTSGRGPSAVPSRFLAVNYQLVANQLQRGYKAIGWSSPYLLDEAVATPIATATLASGILQFAVLAILEDGSMVSLLSPPGNAAGITAPATFDGQTVPSGWTALVSARPPAPSTLTPITARVRALLVAIASVDEQNFNLLVSSTVPTFTQATTSDPVAAWETDLANASGIPGPARAAIRFHSKVIPFP